MTYRKPTFKVILIGNSGVGKTALRHRYFGRGFHKQYLMTLGSDFALKELDHAYAQIWDLAGQISFQTIRRVYYKGTHGIILVFDLTDEKSFADLDQWIEEVELNNGLVPIVLVGNKNDLLSKDNPTEIMEEQIKDFIKQKQTEYDIPITYFKTSAKTGKNVKSMFKALFGYMKFQYN